MLRYVLRRILANALNLAAISVLAFWLVAISGDPLAGLRLDPRIPKSTIELRIHQLHLDKGLVERYWIWLRGVLHGDFGVSTSLNQPVAASFTAHFAVTLRMVIGATLLSIVVAVVTGVVAALRRGRLVDRGVTFSNFIFLAVPTFVLALFLKLYVAGPINTHFGSLGNPVLPVSLDQSPTQTGGFFQRLPDYAVHMILPTITLTLVTYASWSLYQRSQVLEALDMDHVRLAKSKGLSGRRVLTHHVLRNALIPVVTVIALDFAGLLGGAIITENVFSWNGLGSWFIDGVNAQDVNLTLAYVMITALFVVVFNLLADVMYAVLDPRIKYD